LVGRVRSGGWWLGWRWRRRIFWVALMKIRQ
jgi:hypothetical protein